MRRGIYLAVLGALAVTVPSWGGDGVVALQTADASCRTTTTPPPRYVDCGNGTVTDNDTGLVWLKQANCLAKCSGTGALCSVDSDCGGHL